MSPSELPKRLPVPLSAGANAGAGFEGIDKDDAPSVAWAEYRAETVSAMPSDPLSEGAPKAFTRAWKSPLRQGRAGSYDVVPMEF
jgi:hypothetical protein